MTKSKTRKILERNFWAQVSKIKFFNLSKAFADFMPSYIQLLLHSFPIKIKNVDLIFRKESRAPNEEHLSTSSKSHKMSNLSSIFLWDISPLELTFIYIAHYIISQRNYLGAGMKHSNCKAICKPVFKKLIQLL